MLEFHKKITGITFSRVFFLLKFKGMPPQPGMQPNHGMPPTSGLHPNAGMPPPPGQQQRDPYAGQGSFGQNQNNRRTLDPDQMPSPIQVYMIYQLSLYLVVNYY